jgi:hypothetical protein
MLSVDSDHSAKCDSLAVEAQLHMMLSSEAVSAGPSSKTFKLQGVLQGQAVLILIDSSSSHSFVTTKLVDSLCDMSVVSKPL